MSIPRSFSAQPHPGSATRPRRQLGFAAFPVANELVLLSPAGDMAHALNESAMSVWKLCDGQHTPLDMLGVLRNCYAGDAVDMLVDLNEALFRFHHLGLIDLAAPTLGGQEDHPVVEHAPLPEHGPRVRFVFGIEDKPYFYWQLAILFESLVGQLAPGWDITVVVCNDHKMLSKELSQLIEVYGVRVITGDNHAHSHEIDFSASQGGYVALNRVEALRAIAAFVAPDDIVCLMDTDVFLYGEMQVDLFPTGNAMASNNIINDTLFMGLGSEKYGVDLQKLLSALGCDRTLKRGGVTVFMTGATVSNEKVIQDCFRFAQIVYLLGKAAGLPDGNVWMAEMACFAMALTANDIDYDLLDTPQFAVPAPQQSAVSEGSFFHYFADINDKPGGPFVGSEWSKQLFYDRNFLAENIESFRRGAKSDVERRFLDLSIAAKRRLHEARAN